MALAKGPRSGDGTPVACLATIAYCTLPHRPARASMHLQERPQWETQGLYEKMQSAFQDAPLGLGEQEEQVHELGPMCVHTCGVRGKRVCTTGSDDMSDTNLV